MSDRDQRVTLDRDVATHIARITLDNQDRHNAYDPPMRRSMRQCLDELALDDDIKVVILRGANGTFSTGADMNNAYRWYGDDGGRRPSQRRRLTVDRETFSFYHEFLSFPKITVAQVERFALGGGFELALMADVAIVGRDARIGMPGARLLGPALGNLHMFFHRLGPVLTKRLLLTGDMIPAGDIEHLGIFTEVCDPSEVANRTELWAQKVARMPADGLVIAKAAFTLVEETQAYVGEEATGSLIHAFATNLRFEADEFNFVKARGAGGVREAFRQRDEHFTVEKFD